MRSESSRLTGQATELVQAGKKDRALLVLKMRRLREEESQKAEAQLLSVEKLVGGVWMCVVDRMIDWKNGRTDTRIRAAAAPIIGCPQITQIEWETEQLKVFDALKSGNQVLEEIHKVRLFEEKSICIPLSSLKLE